MADRQAFNIVLPLLSKDLSLTPVQTGLVASVFLWVYSVLVPVGGFLGDIARRKWIVFASLMVWSVGTMLSGAATGLVGLILFRGIATGGGEAFYFPSASSLIGQHHKDTRAMAMSIHTTALYVGIIASGFVAGWIGEHYGWRSVFYVFGAVGIVLAATIAWRMKDTPQPPHSTGAGKVPLRELFHEIAGKPTVWAIWVSCCCFYFAQIGYLTWMRRTCTRNSASRSPTRASPPVLAARLRGGRVLVAARSPTCWPSAVPPPASRRRSRASSAAHRFYS
jgi:MFS family permease